MHRGDVGLPPYVLEPHGNTNQSRPTPPNGALDAWIDDRKGNNDDLNGSLPQPPPTLKEPQTPLVHEVLNGGLPPCALEPHGSTNRSHPTPPNGSPDVWIDERKENTEDPNRNLPQTPPTLKESPTLMAHKIMNVNQPPCILEPHALTNRLHPTPPKGSPDEWMNATKVNMAEQHKNLPHPPPLSK